MKTKQLFQLLFIALFILMIIGCNNRTFPTQQPPSQNQTGETSGGNQITIVDYITWLFSLAALIVSLSTNHTMILRTYPRCLLQLKISDTSFRESFMQLDNPYVEITFNNPAERADLEKVGLEVEIKRVGLVGLFKPTKMTKVRYFGEIKKSNSINYEIPIDDQLIRDLTLFDEPLLQNFLFRVRKPIQAILNKWNEQLQRSLREVITKQLAKGTSTSNDKEIDFIVLRILVSEENEIDLADLKGKLKFKTPLFRKILIKINNFLRRLQYRSKPMRNEFQIQMRVSFKWTPLLAGAKQVRQTKTIRILPEWTSEINPAYKSFEYKDELKPKVYSLSKWKIIDEKESLHYTFSL